MKFRKWLFSALALLALAWILYGLSVVTDAAQLTASESEAQYAADSLSRSSAYLGIGIGASLGAGFFLCTGLPLLLLFSVLAWRNAVGIREKTRHQEVLHALRHE